MDKIIWVVEEHRERMLDIQRKINSYGGMRAMCMLTIDAMKNTITERIDKGYSHRSNPSLILMDYDVISEDDVALKILKSHPKLAGVPLFLLVDSVDSNTNQKFYFMGAMVVLSKNLENSDIVRIERAAWQYEITKSYEYVVQKQVTELETAKKIKKLNDQLAARNEFLHTIFGKYFSDEFIEILLDRQETELLGGDRRHIAVLFSDLRGFSSIAEEISGENMTALLNCFFGAMMEGINRYHGTVIEYMGDGVLAVFGAPVKDENYCENAIAAGITMQKAMTKVNAYCRQMGYPKLNLGVAIHCGEGFVGNVGTEEMMRYNVIGSVVNACSRIEGCSLGGQVLVSKELVSRLKVPVKIKERSQIFAKGIKIPIEICQVEGISGNYNCFLDRANPPKKYKVENEVSVMIHKIHNKVVDKYGQKACILFLSHNELILKQPESGPKYYDTDLYSDVEIIGDEFTGAYCKVVKVNDDDISLFVTRKSQEYIDFYGGLIRGIINKEAAMINGIDVEKLRKEMIIKEVTPDLLEKEPEHKIILLWAIEGEDVKVRFHSENKQIRALEFVDFLLGEYGMVKGNETDAGGIISKILLSVLMSEIDEKDIGEFFNRITWMYFDECDWIFADEYVKANKDDIFKLPKYVKKPVTWAFVKTMDIATYGTKFLLRSLENESDVELMASEDLYIMIGCRGEIYNISRDKFMRTYDMTDEAFDVYEKLPEYMPEVRLCEDNTYISLDDKAKLCYPKSGRAIYAKPLTCHTKVFSKENHGEYFVGKPGDYLALRTDDLEDIYIIQREIFEETYVLQE